MKVAKFGGSSLADATHVQKVLEIIKADPERAVVVVSAPGKRSASDTKVTDLLIQYVDAILNQAPSAAIVTAIFQRYLAIGDAFGLTKQDLAPIHDDLMALPFEPYQNDDYLLAAFKAQGERQNARLLTAILNTTGTPARYLDPQDAGIMVTDRPNDASIMSDSYRLMATLPSVSQITVVPGFFGYNQQGQICTFSRGGSDITGAILARGLHADRYENFTDVDAIYAANPKVVHHPIAIHHLTFREMRELAYAGFSVFHDEALIPAIEGNVPVIVKNTNHPAERGTLISPTKRINPAYPVSGIASKPNFCGIYIRKYLLDKRRVSQKIVNVLANHGLTYEHMPSGIDDITVILGQDQLTPEVEDAVLRELTIALKPDEISVHRDYALLMVVGEGMVNRSGIMAKATEALARQNVKLVMVNQGASEIAMMFGIQQRDAEVSVQALYDSFFPDL